MLLINLICIKQFHQQISAGMTNGQRPAITCIIEIPVMIIKIITRDYEMFIFQISILKQIENC